MSLLVKYRIQPDSVNRGQTEAYRPPSTREIVAELVERRTINYEAAVDAWDRDVRRMFDAYEEYDNDDWLLQRLTKCVNAALGIDEEAHR